MRSLGIENHTDNAEDLVALAHTALCSSQMQQSHLGFQTIPEILEFLKEPLKDNKIPINLPFQEQQKNLQQTEDLRDSGLQTALGIRPKH